MEDAHYPEPQSNAVKRRVDAIQIDASLSAPYACLSLSF
jgi:hypothetical protein